MADGRAPLPTTSPRPAVWTEIFRCFQIALDPKKLFVAAAGILVMSSLWWLLSVIFYYDAPKLSEDPYSTNNVQKDFVGKNDPATGKPYDNDTLPVAVEAERVRRFNADFEQWKVLDSLAGPGGRLRTMPWYEYRGPNPFLLSTDLISGSAADRKNALEGFAYGSVPVLVEPLVKLLIPVSKLISPGVNTTTRVYLFLILLCNIAVWAFCGGIITRLAAVQYANKGPISLGQAYRFVRARYIGYLGTPLIPLGIIAVCVFGMILYGVLALIPVLGDLFILGVGLPIVIVAGGVMAVFLVGLIGYPLMYTTLSTEGDQTDPFDALSRSINYVYQSPWHYLWYWLVAIFYGAAVTLFVLFFTSLTVYVGKWAVGLTASTVWTDRKPEYLFIYAPESFGWRELLTKDSPYAVRGEWQQLESGRQVFVTRPVDQAAFDRARAEFYKYNYWGAGIVAFWLTLMFLLMLGFTYSFFWSAATIIYFLMRKRVDEAELDEVYTEDEEPEPPLAPPKLAEGTGTPPAPATSLPVIVPPPPAVSPPPPPPPPPASLPVPPPPMPPIAVVESPPPPPPPPPALPPAPAMLPLPPATLPFTPPESPKASDEPKEHKASDEHKTSEEPKKPDDEAPLG
jgi:hypothetical protein